MININFIVREVLFTFGLLIFVTDYLTSEDIFISIDLEWPINTKTFHEPRKVQL